MSNFIDHWLNSIPIEEATRAKKLKRQGKISPEDYAKAEQSLEQRLSMYVTDDPDKMHYITFVSDMAALKDKTGKMVYDTDLTLDIDADEKHKKLVSGKRSPAQTKVGINPVSRYDTPNGIYTYPLTSRMFRTMLDGAIGGHGFAQGSPFVALIKPKDYSKILQLQSDSDFKRKISDTPFDISVDQNAMMTSEAGEALKNDIEKLFGRDSKIRKKIKETKIQDYSRGTHLVQKIEELIIAKEVEKFKSLVPSFANLDKEKMAEGLYELSDRANFDSTERLLHQMAMQYKIDERYPRASFDMTTYFTALAIKATENIDKAMFRIDDEDDINNVSMLSMFYDGIQNNISRLAAGLDYFIDEEGKSIDYNGDYKSPEYLTSVIIYCLINGFHSMISFSIVRKMLDGFLPTSEEGGKVYNNMINLMNDTVDKFNESYDSVHGDKVGQIVRSALPRMLADLFTLCSLTAVKIKKLRAEFRELGEDTGPISQLYKFFMFARSLLHPSRLPAKTKRLAQQIVKDDLNPHQFTLNTFTNSFIASSDKLKDFYFDGNKFYFKKDRKERKKLSDSYIYVRSVEWGRLKRELGELLESATVASEDMQNAVAEAGLTQEEVDFIASSLTNNRYPELNYYPNEENLQIIDGLVDKFYNPTGDDLIALEPIQKIMKGSRTKNPTGVLWNITRHMAGVSSVRHSVDGDKGFKRVPALWNTIWRFLGYDGAADLNDSGTIHPSEMTQAVFFNRRFIEVIEVFTNTLSSGSKEKNMAPFFRELALRTCIKNTVGDTKVGDTSIKPSDVASTAFSINIYSKSLLPEIDRFIDFGLIDSSYTEVYLQAKSVKTYKDAMKLSNNTDFADLICMAYIFRYTVTDIARYGFDQLYKPLIPTKEIEEISENPSLRAYSLVLDYYALLISSVTNQNYITSLNRVPKDSTITSTGKMFKELESYIIPNLLLQFLFEEVGMSSDVSEYVLNGKINIKDLHRVKNPFALKPNKLQQDLYNVIWRKMWPYISERRRKVPEILTDTIEELLRTNDTVVRSLSYTAKIELLQLKEPGKRYDGTIKENIARIADVAVKKAIRTIKEVVGHHEFVQHDPLNEELFQEMPTEVFFKDSSVNKGKKLEDYEVPYLYGNEQVAEELLRWFIWRRSYQILDFLLKCFKIPKDNIGGIPDYYKAFLDSASSEPPPLEEINKLINDVEKLLNG